MLGDGTINSPAMFVSIAVLVIVVAAIAVSVIHRFVNRFEVALVLQLVLLAAVISIFVWLR
jgi:uncharacterized membrane protein YoaK (UPF0700 family)